MAKRRGTGRPLIALEASPGAREIGNRVEASPPKGRPLQIRQYIPQGMARVYRRARVDTLCGQRM